jgi:hypothetical protein
MLPRPWFESAWRRAVIDMHIPDWDPTFLSEFNADRYVEALVQSRAQSIVCYAHSHVGLFHYAAFHGVARATIPHNPKTAVTQACRHEPMLHRTYQDMAAHYGTPIIPARPRKPRDKSKVETGVQISERHILAALRDQRCFSIGELNPSRRKDRSLSIAGLDFAACRL